MSTSQDQINRGRWPLLTGISVGILAAALTLAIEQMSAISDSRLLGTLQMIGWCLLLPGLLLSLIVSGNVHDISIPVATIANIGFYALLGYLCMRLINRCKSA